MTTDTKANIDPLGINGRLVRFKGTTYTRNDYVSSGPAAHLLNISQTTLYRYTKNKWIRCLERSLTRVESFYKVADLLDFAKAKGMIVNTTLLVESNKESN